ncbi:MAG: hypothetical protein L6W00_21240 [Lentisphaeria bacterium]|nr:MAG: hypothetical protein L6W00_21240 [Lentisphaeria bacterium]
MHRMPGWSSASCSVRPVPLPGYCVLELELRSRKRGAPSSDRHFPAHGDGGFHMHARTGLATPYLGPEFMARVRDCVREARNSGMLAWLYDEDRWPSGAAGGW